MFNDAGCLSIILGFVLILIPLVISFLSGYVIKKYFETAIILNMLRSYFLLVLTGVILIILGVLYKMGFILWLLNK